ncbi:MAG: copper chaperone PCu(A)C [Pseudomonadota bacterium]
MRIFVLTATICISALIAFQAYADTHVKIEKPYAFATAENQRAGAAFMTITVGESDTLISASADVSETVEIHDMAMEDGMMKMRKLDTMPIEDSATLEPTGKHIMFIGLNEPLKEGESFPLTLTFEKAGEQTVDVAIVAPGKKPEDAKDHKGHDHHDHHDHGHDHHHGHDH